MDALGFLVMGVGVWLLYAAYKGEHPWTIFQSTLSSASTPATSSATSSGGTLLNPAQNSPVAVTNATSAAFGG